VSARWSPRRRRPAETVTRAHAVGFDLAADLRHQAVPLRAGQFLLKIRRPGTTPLPQ
jgi:hypothetical protein